MSTLRLALVLAGLLSSAALAALAAQPQDRDARYPATPGIRVSGLPREARETPALIRTGTRAWQLSRVHRHDTKQEGSRRPQNCCRQARRVPLH
jgi:hypothetical protein